MEKPRQRTSKQERENAFREFRQDVEEEMQKAIVRHELKMSGIGILTLLVFLAIIGLALVF
uniref:Uncharacterized protein n=1 Tax=Cyanothece sp. (strain PCC 7425 / ATCC 29141) TaxID=395961 RepID=B8HLS3_CYAP4